MSIKQKPTIWLVVWATISLLACIEVNGHGFGQYTYVRTAPGWECIYQVAESIVHAPQSIISCDTHHCQRTVRQAITSGKSETNCYFRLCFDERDVDDILCTPTQEFYLPLQQRWAPAYSLQVGDTLLRECTTLKPLTSIEFVKKPLTVYTLEVAESHTFLVGCYSILTHNMFIPVAMTIGMQIPFGSVALGTAGSFFGPVTLYGGFILGAMAGAVLKALWQSNEPVNYELNFNAQELDGHRMRMEEEKQTACTIRSSTPCLAYGNNVENNTNQNPTKNKKNDDSRGPNKTPEEQATVAALLKSLDDNKEKALEVFNRTCEYIRSVGDGVKIINHSFLNYVKHNFGPLLTRMGVNLHAEEAERNKQILDAGYKILVDVARQLIAKGSQLSVSVEGLFKETMEHRGELITVRGCVHDGIIKIGTMFIQPQHVR